MSEQRWKAGDRVRMSSTAYERQFQVGEILDFRFGGGMANVRFDDGEMMVMYTSWFEAATPPEGAGEGGG